MLGSDPNDCAAAIGVPNDDFRRLEVASNEAFTRGNQIPFGCTANAEMMV